MGILERTEKLREAARTGILHAALLIVKNEGWKALSMRRIADSIGYTTPVIYEYYAGKDGLLAEMTRVGFRNLAAAVTRAGRKFSNPLLKLNSMWIAYWEYAMAEKELYQLMLGVDKTCGNYKILTVEAEIISKVIIPVIRNAFADKCLEEEWIKAKYFTYWSAVHGLVAISFIHPGRSAIFYRKVLQDSLSGIRLAL